MSCSFCPGHTRDKRRMSMAEFDTLTDKLQGFTKYLYYHLMGEPLTHPELCDFIRLASSKGYKSVVTTNGTLLPRHGDALIACGVYKVNLSLHSFEGESDSAFHSYLDSCLDFADKASRAGVLVILRLWNAGHDGGRNDGVLVRLKEKFSDGEWVSAPDGARIRHRLHLEYGERFDWPDTSAEDGGEDVFCYALSDHFGILCDGTVVPCCLDRNGDLALGNAFQEDIGDILSSPRATAILNAFKQRKAHEPLCRKCGYARRFV